jgi:phosphoglycerate kinase
MQKITSVSEADVRGKRVLVRADCNVPMVTVDGKSQVAGDLRIRAILPTLELLHTNGAAQILILAHLGRPGGKVDEAMRLAPVEARLRELTQVPFVMHENLRFDPREEANDPAFAQELAALGDVYVNEAFADSHRAHASIVGVPKRLPSYAGLRFTLEVQKLSGALTPPHGALAIVGGDKFDTKQPLIAKLLSLYGEVLLGGALGNDVIKARGMPFGDSLISSVPVPPEIAVDEHLMVPTDAVFSEVSSNAERIGSVVDIRANEAVIDIGPQTAALWSDKIKKAPFVLWNGPMGLYEKGYADGTDALAQTLAESKVPAVVGGGDTAAAVEKYNFDPEKVFVSTGGGAMLEFLTAGTLPGIEALTTSAE